MSEPNDILQGADLHALLPHRYPFLLVDRIAVVEPRRKVVGTKRVTSGEWWCNPENVAMRGMPFSLVIEALAQTSGALVRDLAEDMVGAIGYFLAADRVRFRYLALPGDEISLDITLSSWRRGVCRTRAVATVDGRLVASAILTTIVRGAT